MSGVYDRVAGDDCNVIVFDVDGVLMDEAGISPRMQGLKLLAKAVGSYRVYIVTGRIELERRVILDLIRDHGIRVRDIAGILMRRVGDTSEEAALKLKLLDRIMDMEGCILELHDNNPRVLDNVKKLVTGALVLHYDEKCEAVKGRSVFSECNRR